MKFRVERVSYYNSNDVPPCKEATKAYNEYGLFWEIEIKDLESLASFSEENGSIIITVKKENARIEIYDDYIE